MGKNGFAYLTGKTAICALMFNTTFVLYLNAKSSLTMCIEQKDAYRNRFCVGLTLNVLHIVLFAYPLNIIQEEENREGNNKKSSVSLIR